MSAHMPFLDALTGIVAGLVLLFAIWGLLI
jgi:hypothetical protein